MCMFSSHRFHRHKRRHVLVFVTIINHFKIKIMSFQLQKKKFVDATLAILDQVTNVDVPATFANVIMESSDPLIFSIKDENADGILDIVGVGVGSATLKVTADATFTNSNGEVVTESKTASIVVDVTAPAADATELVVTLK